MIQITVGTRRAVVTNKELLTTGSAGIQVQFAFSEDWDGLSKFAIFRNGDDGQEVPVALPNSNLVTIPSQSCSEDYVDETVFVGVYGSDGVGGVIIPTVWTSLGVLRPGAVTTDIITPPEPTPDMWAQILAIANEAAAIADECEENEELRIAAEQLRADAEIARANAETLRATAETTRVQNETQRQSAEIQRQIAENARAQAEVLRVQAEELRQANETSRVSAESGRASAEQTRQSQEATRASNETARITAEQNRASAETQRANAESSRVAAETSRASAESSRATAEQNRISAETARASAESQRVTAENNRVSAEQSRVNAEAGRVQAETDRATEFATWKSTIDGMRGNLLPKIGNFNGGGPGLTITWNAEKTRATITGTSLIDLDLPLYETMIGSDSSQSGWSDLLEYGKTYQIRFSATNANTTLSVTDSAGSRNCNGDTTFRVESGDSWSIAISFVAGEVADGTVDIALIEAKSIVDVEDDVADLTRQLSEITDISEALISGEYILISSGNVGVVGTNSAYSRTDYLPVLPGMIVEMFEDWSGGVVGACWYDVNKHPFQAISNSESVGRKVSLIVPENAYYIRTSVQNSHITWYPYIVRIFPSGEKVAENFIALNLEVSAQSFNYLPKNVYREVYSDANLVTGYENGYINDSGVIKTSGDYKHSNYIDLSGSTNGNIYLNSGFVYWQYYAFYDSDKNYLGGKNQYASPRVTGGIATWAIPTGAKYLIISYSSTDQAQASWASYTGAQPTGAVINATVESYRSYSDYPTNPCDYGGAEISLFHKGICIGDSLTAGVCNYRQGGSEIINTTFPNYSYPTYLARLSGVETVNAGIGGLTTAQWYSTYLASHADWSGYDFAIIQLGVNDAIQNHGWTQEEETALNNIITKLKTDNQRIKIFVATILPATAYSGTSYDDISEHTRTFVSDLGDADVILVDIAEYAHTAESIAYNAGHLTGLGYLRLAMDYKAYISMIIRDNPIDFRFMQFAGTDYSY